MTPGGRPKGRVLIVIRQFFPLAAGAETQALRQARSYIEMGYEARVVTARHDPSLPRSELIRGVPVRRLPAPRVRFFGSIVFLCRLVHFLFAHRGEYDSVLAFHLKQASAATALACRVLRKRLVISVQAAGAEGDVRALEGAALGAVIRRCCGWADAYVSGASEITSELVEAGFDRGRIHLIPNGIPVEAFRTCLDKAELRRRLSLPRDGFIAVNVGRHTAQKDLGTVLAAWRRFAPRRPEALLVLVGDGDQRSQLEAFVARNDLAGSVRFEGWRANVAEYLGAADVFVSSSLFEGTHIALGEAMAAGLPVIATPVGGARDFVKDGENGFLIGIGDESGLAAGMEMLADDAGLKENMGAAARETAERELSQHETAAAHLRALLPARPPRRRRRLRITHLIATLDRGGSERQMAELAARMDRDRFEVRVIALTRGGPTGEILDAAGVAREVLGKRGKFDFGCFIRLVWTLAARPPDVLHTWLFTSNVYGRAAALVSGVRRLIASERSTDPWKSPAHRVLDRLLAVGTARIVANSAAVRRSLVDSGIGRAKIAVIPNGIDCERFRPRDARDARFALGLPVEGELFGYVGRLAEEKDPQAFIEAARAVLGRRENARAVLFGGGPLEGRLRAQAANLGERVIFYGDCPRPEIAHAALDCLVLTSRWEGFPNAVLEAMACARPVAAFRMPATAELIESGATGILVEPRADELARAVCELLGDPPRRKSMGARARRLVESRYSMDRMVARWQRLYLDTAEE